MFVYILTNTKNGKQYVGQTCGPVGYRWRAHVSEARRKANCPLLARAIVKYGPDVFSVAFIDLTGSSQEWLNFVERWFIDELNTQKPNGYNLEPGGRNGKHSEETKQKIGMAHRGLKRSAQARENMSAWQRGIKRSAHHVEAIRRASTGRKHKPETKLKQSLAKKGRPSPLRGRKWGPMPEETKRKLSESKKGKKRSLTEQQKQDLSSKFQRLWQTDQYRQKVLAARVGRHRISPEGIQRLRESKTEYWRKFKEARANGG